MQKDCRPQPKGVNSFYLLSELFSGTAVLTNKPVRTFARDFPGVGLTFPARSELATSPPSHFLGPVAVTKLGWGRGVGRWGVRCHLSLEAGAMLFGFGVCFSGGAQGLECFHGSLPAARKQLALRISIRGL